jgi:hypothetical protein
VLLGGMSFYIFNRNLIIGSLFLLLFLLLVYRMEKERLKKIFLNRM